MTHARRKGQVYERDVFHFLQAWPELDYTPENRSGYDGEDGRMHLPYTEVSIEAKNQKAMELAEWIDQAREQASGDPAIVIHKRRGRSSVAEHYATMSVSDLVTLLLRAHGQYRPAQDHPDGPVSPDRAGLTTDPD